MPGPVQANPTALGADFVVAAERALRSGTLEQVPDATLERVMTAAVRLYAAKADSENPTVRPITPEVPSSRCTRACSSEDRTMTIKNTARRR